jgi:PIN domain nuclease of toxin-antitoxin system
MKLLLDTHVAIWAVHRPHYLSAAALRLIENEANKIVVSAASIWEIAIKRKRGGRDLPPFDSADAIEMFQEAGFELASISAEDCAFTQSLDLIHHDPFDRLMIAQALREPYRLVTRDAIVARYSPSIILV